MNGKLQIREPVMPNTKANAMSRMRMMRLALAATTIALGGFSLQGATALVSPRSSTAEVMLGDSGVVELVSHWRWETRCFDRKKRVCPPPCPGGPRVCRPRRCWYETVHTCRPVRVKNPH
jgi:hypothetical protein